MNRHCCKVGCADAAAFEIVHLTGNYEDTTDSCLTHVGDLLGSNGDAEWGTYSIEIHPLPKPPTGDGPQLADLAVADPFNPLPKGLVAVLAADRLGA